MGMDEAKAEFDPKTGYTEIEIFGSPSNEKFKELEQQILAINHQLVADKKLRLGMIDLSKENVYAPNSVSSAFELIKSIEYDYTAIFGVEALPAAVLSAIVQSTRKARITGVFRSRTQAVEWIESLTRDHKK